MELPIDILKELDEFVGKLDESDCVIDRHVAIRETARLLISLTHDEHYGINDGFDNRCRGVSRAWQHFVRRESDVMK